MDDFRPPIAVPNPMDKPAATLTQLGTVNSLYEPYATKAMATIPIAFCASDAPWLNAINADETICNGLKIRFTRERGMVWKSFRINLIRLPEKSAPNTGEINMATRIIIIP